MEQRVLQMDGVEEFIHEEMAGLYGNYKTTQDRKYAIYSMFRYNEGARGFTVEKYPGSLQVVLRVDGEVLYDSFNESFMQRHPHLFAYWLKKKVVIPYLIRRDNASQ